VTQELLYTSAAQGLDPGSRGFCTVVRTRSMPAPLAPLLESLSGYRPAFAINDPRAAENPVSYSHVRVAAGGKTYSVLSRVADYGLDYSQRTNKIAHHVALASDERPEAGPAWLLVQPGFMDTRWDGQPRTLPAGRRVPTGAERVAACPTWAAVTGDAGWAGILAESWLTGTASYLIVAPGTDTLALIREAVALLPPRKRWDATFSTYYTGMPGSATCSCRCVLTDSQEAIQAHRLPNVLRIDLTQKLPADRSGDLVNVARTGPLKRTPTGRSQPAPASLPHTSESESVPFAIPLAGTTPRTREGILLQNVPAGPPPLEPRIRKVEDKKRVPVWVWLIASLSAAAVVFGSIFLYAVNHPRQAPIQVAGGDATIGEAKKQAPQPVNAGEENKNKTAEERKDHKAPASAKAVATPPSSTSAKTSVAAKAGAAGPKAANQASPTNSTVAKDPKSVEPLPSTSQSASGKPDPQSTSKPLTVAGIAANAARPDDPKKPPRPPARTDPRETQNPAHGLNAASAPLRLPSVLLLPSDLKPKQEATLIAGADSPGQSRPWSLSLWLPSDGKQSLKVSKGSDTSVALCQAATGSDDLVRFRLNDRTREITITASTPRAEAIKALYFCVLCVGQGHERKTFQFFRPSVAAPGSPAPEHKRPSWTIPVSGPIQEMPPLAVEVATVQLTSKTSQTTYAFRPEMAQDKKGGALLASLMSSELNQQLLAVTGSKSERADINLALHVKQTATSVDFWFGSEDMKRLFTAVTNVQTSRLIDIMVNYRDPSPDQLKKQHDEAARNIKRQKGNERQKVSAALKSFRDKLQEPLDPAKLKSFQRILGDLDRLQNDLERTDGLQNDLNAAVLKGARLFYHVSDQDGQIQRNYVVKLESDLD
jgi:hypothetical protein